MKPQQFLLNKKPLIIVGSFAIALLIGGYIESRRPQTADISTKNMSDTTQEVLETQADDNSNDRYSETVNNSANKLCKRNEKYLVKAVKDALNGSSPGTKILKVGPTSAADANESTTSMGGEVVASCKTDVYASIGGKYPVDWNVELDGDQYFVATAPLLNSTQKQVIGDWEQEMEEAEAQQEKLLMELSRELCDAGVESEC